MKYLTIAILAFSLNAFAQLPNNKSVVLSSGVASGDVVMANPTALPDNICSGITVQLNAMPSSGTGNYTYSWTSDPSGFTSDSPNPLVTPLVTTNYSVEINDGSNITSGSVTVFVKPLPRINLIPENNPEIQIISQEEISVCAFQSVTIDAGNPGSTYLWSNNSVDQTIIAETSGISVDFQEFEVTVTDPATGCSNSANISVWFTFTDCVYGVEENNQGDMLTLYPNPSQDGSFNYIFEQIKGEITIEVYSSQGTLIKRDVTPNCQDSPYKSTLDLSHQSPGVYLLKATNNKDVIQRKLIIQ